MGASAEIHVRAASKLHRFCPESLLGPSLQSNTVSFTHSGACWNISSQVNVDCHIYKHQTHGLSVRLFWLDIQDSIATIPFRNFTWSPKNRLCLADLPARSSTRTSSHVRLAHACLPGPFLSARESSILPCPPDCASTLSPDRGDPSGLSRTLRKS